jgi:hypothetical protein
MEKKSLLNKNGNLRLSCYLPLFFWAHLYLIKALILQKSSLINNIKLVALNDKCRWSLSDKAIFFVIDTVRILQNRYITKTSHGCFYRSYVSAMVLRRFGVNIKMHFGLRNFLGKSEMPETKGHCWLTLDDVALKEEYPPDELYSTLISETDGGICYWAGENDGPKIVRKKNTNN